MRVLKLLALGFIAWVSYSVATAKPRQAESLDTIFDDDEPPIGDAPRPGKSAADERPSRFPQGNGSKRAAPARQRVRWCVRVPENTPRNAAVYVTGSHPDLGNWSPLGLPLKNDGPYLYFGEFEFATGTVLEYKFTRGSWEAVETLRGGVPRPNRALAVRAPEVVHAEVEAWSDRA